MKPPVPRGKTMRVATALTGMTACAGGFLPTAAAHAAPAGRAGNLPKAHTGEAKLARLKVFQGGITPDLRTMRPDITADPAQPYWLDIFLSANVTEFYVCGPHLNGVHRCTSTIHVSKQAGEYTWSHVGGNNYSWTLGKISVFWNGGGPGHRDFCNTTGHWHGVWMPGASGHESASLSGGVISSMHTPIGNGVPEC